MQLRQKSKQSVKQAEKLAGEHGNKASRMTSRQKVGGQASRQAGRTDLPKPVHMIGLITLLLLPSADVDVARVISPAYTYTFVDENNMTSHDCFRLNLK